MKPHLMHGLANRAIRGVGWAIAATGTGKFLSFIGLTLLARLLAPAEFGLFAFAILYLTYVDTLGDLGTGAALVHWPSRQADAAQVTFAVSVVMGVALFLLTFALAPTVAAFFQTPSGASVLRVLGVSFVIKGLGNTHDALCRKQLRFRARLVPEVALTGVKAAVAVALAVAGLGVWSLVWGQLVGMTLWTILLWRAVPWRPGWRWPIDLTRSMFGYGRHIVAVNLLAAIVHHVDAVIVGRMLGIAALGFYQLATRVPEMAVTLLVRQVSLVLFPTFSTVHAAGNSVRETYLTALRYTALVTGPAAIALVGLAEPLVTTLFGDGWQPVVPILQALAIYAGVRALGSLAGDVLKATGRPGLLAALAVLKAVILIPVLVLAARWGPVGVAAALAAVTSGTSLVTLLVVNRWLGIGMRRIGIALRPSGYATGAVGVVIAGWVYAIPAPVDALTLAGGVLTGVAVYLVAVRLQTPELYRTLAQAVGR